MLETCGETCGWTAALLACLLFGSYGVPMKCEASEKVDVDPLVFQTYRTIVCVLSCWLVLPFGAKVTFTPWGIVSGFFWLPGAVAGIYAVRKAGLAVSQGVWSSVIVFVSVAWGVFIFHESVRSVMGTCNAALLLIIGNCGMSYYSSPRRKRAQVIHDSLSFSLPIATPGQSARRDGLSDSFDHFFYGSINAVPSTPTAENNQTVEAKIYDVTSELYPQGSHTPTSVRSSPDSPEFDVCGIQVPKYQAGVAAAAFNGIWAGTILVPLHYSGPSTKGLQFVISFAIGAIIINAAMWAFRIIYHLYLMKSLKAALHAMPPFHVREMMVPASVAGVLWSTGNICGIVAVTSLGLGVGQSVIQISMLISGLWGIFWYHEVQGAVDITLWIVSALLACIGVLWLSHEHIQE